jgi:hypothetical protein
MSKTITFKRGGTFSYGSLVQMPAGTWAAACKLTDEDGNPVQTMSVSLTPPVAPSTKHALLIECLASATAGWPAGKTLKGDIVFTDASSPAVVLPTSTFYVEVQESQTL